MPATIARLHLWSHDERSDEYLLFDRAHEERSDERLLFSIARSPIRRDFYFLVVLRLDRLSAILFVLVIRGELAARGLSSLGNAAPAKASTLEKTIR